MRKILLFAFLFFNSACIDNPITEEENDNGQKAKALFYTAGIVHSNSAVVRETARKISKSPNYNSILALLDMGPEGRFYAFAGRGETAISQQAIENIKIYKSFGVRPIVIIRSDWAARTKSRVIPSVGGKRASNSTFYTDELLQQETIFISNFSDAVNGVDIMYALEASAIQSVDFYLKLIENTRKVAGFRGRIYVNFIGQAKQEFELRKSEFQKFNVKSATSQNSLAWNLSEDVVNTDGNLSISPENAVQVIEALKQTKKPYIFWSVGTQANDNAGVISDIYF